MKDLSFLKSRYFVYKGIYDNKNVYENTLEAIKVAIRKNKVVKWDKVQKSGRKKMINFEKELKNFEPSLEVEEAESAIYNHDMTDVTDIIAEILRDVKAGR